MDMTSNCVTLASVFMNKLVSELTHLKYNQKTITQVVVILEPFFGKKWL